MKKGFVWTAAAILLAAESMTALAGGINGPEASVISVACGTFTYNGKTYVAKAAYQAQLQAKLSEDGIDLSQEQADEAISLIYANVETGVVQGYLEEVGGSSEETESEEESEGQEEAEDKRRKESQSGQKAQDAESNAAEEGESQTQGSPSAAESGQAQSVQEDSWTVEEAIAADEEAFDYNGYNIEEIYEKDEEDRTEEEQQAYDQYVAEKAVDQLHLGEEEPQDREKAAEEESESWMQNESTGRVLVLFVGFLAGGVILALLIRRGIRERKAALLRKDLPDAYVDIHSHILPGADDGSPDMETTVQMADAAYGCGIRYMIATPHYQRGSKHLKVEDLRKVYQQTQEVLCKEYPDFHLLLGNEICFSEGCIEKLEQGRALTLAGSRYVLVEFPFDSSAKQIMQAVVSLLRERYIPVLAHAERYRNLVRDMECVKEIRRMGAWIQINASCRKAAVKLMKHGCVDLIATDCHDLRKRAPKLKKGLHRLCLYGDKKMLERILVQNPQKIVTTEEENREES